VAPTEATFQRVFETARALGEETRFRIYRQLGLSPVPISVSELAEVFSVHPNAVRQHLARLEQAGLVTSRLHREGSAGRPRRLYWASPEPPAFSTPGHPMRAFSTMLEEALDVLPAGRKQLVAFGRAWGRAWARARKRGHPTPRSRRARVELVTAELAEWGWEPFTRQDNGTFNVETGRCLFRATAPGAHGRCCAVEQGLLTGLVEGLLDGRVSATVDGCRFRLTV
jgi:predicted ArsR family transcriptional regulator